MKYSDVILQPLKNHKFRLLKPLKYKNMAVPKGFMTDGASVPRAFWWLFPPNRTDYLPCAILHDFLCEKREFKKADKILKECLKELKVDRFTIFVMYAAVRLYHIVRYGE